MPVIMELSERRFAEACTLYANQRLPEALSALDALAADDPAYPNAVYMRAGLLRLQHGDLNACVLEAYELVLRHDPLNLYAQVERADVLRANGRYEEAQAVYAQIGAETSSADEALRTEATFQLGCAALVLQDNDTARRAFQQVLDTAPDYPDAAAMFALVNEDQEEQQEPPI